jgi:aquaporin Z
LRKIFFAELIGTGLLLLIGLSLVIFMFAAGGPGERLIPGFTLRQVITGFLFGGTGAVIAISALGKASGAHINPVVTMTFWLFKKIDSKTVVVYVLGQFAGATIGVLLCWPGAIWVAA